MAGMFGLAMLGAASGMDAYKQRQDELGYLKMQRSQELQGMQLANEQKQIQLNQMRSQEQFRQQYMAQQGLANAAMQPYRDADQTVATDEQVNRMSAVNVEPGNIKTGYDALRSSQQTFSFLSGQQQQNIKKASDFEMMGMKDLATHYRELAKVNENQIKTLTTQQGRIQSDILRAEDKDETRLVNELEYMTESPKNLTQEAWSKTLSSFANNPKIQGYIKNAGITGDVNADRPKIDRLASQTTKWAEIQKQRRAAAEEQLKQEAEKRRARESDARIARLAESVTNKLEKGHEVKSAFDNHPEVFNTQELSRDAVSDITSAMNKSTRSGSQRVTSGEVRSVYNQIAPEFRDNVDTAMGIQQVGGAIEAIKQGKEISNFIRDNKIKTGLIGEGLKKIDSLGLSDGSHVDMEKMNSVVGNQVLSKMVLDYANAYARSVRGGANPIATVAELKAAIQTFGTSGMSSGSSVAAFSKFSDMLKAKVADKYFQGNADAIKIHGLDDKKQPSGKAETATANGKTYDRPANFTDEQWARYKKDVGAR